MARVGGDQLSSIGLVPVRCTTCLKTLANKCEIWEEWLGRRFGEQATKGEEQVAKMQDRVLQHMGLDLDCCRRMFLALPDTVLPYVPLRPVRKTAPIPLPAQVKKCDAGAEAKEEEMEREIGQQTGSKRGRRKKKWSFL